MNDGYPKNIRFRRRAFYVEKMEEIDRDIYFTPEEAKKLGVKHLLVIKEKLLHDSSMWLCTLNDRNNGLIFYGVGRLNKNKDKYFKKTAKAYAHSRASLQRQRYEEEQNSSPWLPNMLLNEAGFVNKRDIHKLCRAFNENKFPIPKQFGILKNSKNQKKETLLCKDACQSYIEAHSPSDHCCFGNKTGEVEYCSEFLVKKEKTDV